MKSKNYFIYIELFFFAMIFLSCKEEFEKTSFVDKRTVFSDIELENTLQLKENNKISILILADPHFSKSKNQKIEYIIESIENKTLPQQEDFLFCAILGDIASDAEVQDYITFQTFRNRLQNCGIEVFCIPGNHDFFDNVQHGKNYMDYVSNKTFYRIKLQNISFYFLDSADGFFGNRQLETLEIKFSTDINKKIIFTHQPFYTEILADKMMNHRECAKFAALLSKSNVEYYFCGHTHKWETQKFPNFTEMILGTAETGYIILTIDNNICSYSIYYL